MGEPGELGLIDHCQFKLEDGVKRRRTPTIWTAVRSGKSDARSWWSSIWVSGGAFMGWTTFRVASTRGPETQTPAPSFSWASRGFASTSITTVPSFIDGTT